MASVQKSKAKKMGSDKKPSAHPPYAEMIKESIAALKERSGSSQIAIAKFIEDKHNLSPNFKKLLLSHLKKLVASETLIKVKNSFKLSAAAKAKAPAKKAAKAKATPAKAKVPPPRNKVATPAAVKAKKVVMKAKKPKSVKAMGKKKVGTKNAKK